MKAPRVDIYGRSEPEIGEHVIVETIGSTEYGIRCDMIEYKNGGNAMVTFGQISRTRLTNIKHFLKPGKLYVMCVSNIGSGYVDLSRKAVSTEDDLEKWKCHKERKTNLSILWKVCEYNETLYDC